jgi:hypothetical protein
VIRLKRRERTVRIPARTARALVLACEDFEEAPESQRGECRDGVVAVAFAVRDEIRAEAKR